MAMAANSCSIATKNWDDGRVRLTHLTDKGG